jgi:hypothetical protein
MSVLSGESLNTKGIHSAHGLIENQGKEDSQKERYRRTLAAKPPALFAPVDLDRADLDCSTLQAPLANA